MQDAEDLREHVKVLASSEGRAVGTPGHKRARKYLSAVLRQFRLSPYSGESYDLVHHTETEELVNVLAVAPGRNREEQPVLIGAHYDTFGALPGADDNAPSFHLTARGNSRFMVSPRDKLSASGMLSWQDHSGAFCVNTEHDQYVQVPFITSCIVSGDRISSRDRHFSARDQLSSSCSSRETISRRMASKVPVLDASGAVYSSGISWNRGSFASRDSSVFRTQEP